MSFVLADAATLFAAFDCAITSALFATCNATIDAAINAAELAADDVSDYAANSPTKRTALCSSV